MSATWRPVRYSNLNMEPNYEIPEWEPPIWRDRDPDNHMLEEIDNVLKVKVLQ